MGSHLRVKTATGLPGAERIGSGKSTGQVGGYGNDKVDGVIRIIHRVAKHEVMEGAIPLGCGTLPSSRASLWPCAYNVNLLVRLRIFSAHLKLKIHRTTVCCYTSKFLLRLDGFAHA